MVTEQLAGSHHGGKLTFWKQSCSEISLSHAAHHFLCGCALRVRNPLRVWRGRHKWHWVTFSSRAPKARKRKGLHCFCLLVYSGILVGLSRQDEHHLLIRVFYSFSLSCYLQWHHNKSLFYWLWLTISSDTDIISFHFIPQTIFLRKIYRNH